MVKTFAAQWTAAALAQHLAESAKLEVGVITPMAPRWWSLEAHDDVQSVCTDLAARLALDPALSAAELDNMKHLAEPQSKQGTP